MAQCKQPADLTSQNRDRLYELSKLKTPHQARLRAMLALPDAALNEAARLMHMEVQLLLQNKLSNSSESRNSVPTYMVHMMNRHNLNPPEKAYRSWRSLGKWYNTYLNDTRRATS